MSPRKPKSVPLEVGAIPPRADVVISGGGMVGMSLAIGLAQQGMQVVVLERVALSSHREPAFDGRVSAIALGSQHILEDIGAWPYIAPHAQPISDIRVSDRQSPFFLHYDHKEVGDEPFGSIAENRHIRIGLHRRAQELESLHIIEGAELASMQPEGASIHIKLSDDRAITASLLLAADGKSSSARTLMGISATTRDYRQTAIVCTIGHSEPHHGLAQERFLPAGPFAVLPMQDNRSSLVWVEPQDRVQAYLDLPEPELLQEITERVGDYLGELRLVGPRFTYPLTLMHAHSYVAPRAALVGDAAHGIHPIAGQGVNLGFRDVAVLCQLLGDRFRLGLDIGSADVLEHYQRWRRFDNVTMLAVTDGLTHLFGTELLPVRLARGLGLWGVSKCPPLKRIFMKHAMGLLGDVPGQKKAAAG